MCFNLILYTMECELVNSREFLGAELTELMKRRNISIEWLSEFSGIKPGNLKRILRGRYSVGIDTYNKLLKPFGYSLGIFPAPCSLSKRHV